MLSLARAPLTLAFLACCALSAQGGCLIIDDDGADGDGAGDDDNSDDDNDGGAMRTLSCDAAVSVELKGQATPLTDDFEQSVLEMVVCGQLSVELVQGVQTGVGRAILTGDSDATPAGWQHRDDGMYTTGSASTEMVSGFYLAHDTSFGEQGELVVHNVFRVDSYLVNARVVISQDAIVTGKAELRFDDTGPLVELLGFGQTPSSPIEVSATDALNLASGLESLEFRSDIHVVDAGESTIIYDVHTRPVLASELLLGATLEYDNDAVTATRGDMSVEVDGWDIEFRGGGGLSGEIEFHIDVDVDLECTSEFTFEATQGD
ncbi:MAG: hypothetical protein JKY37_19720 [Nannocystaceae bacterium]|nr:hypothetical protein [Nannocystaceae bacterium]